MPGASNKKRPIEGRRRQRPSKKQKRQQEYHSESESEDQDFAAVDLLASDDEEDIHNATVDDVQSDDQPPSSEDEEEAPTPKKTSKLKMRIKQPQKSQGADSEGQSSEEDEDENLNDDDDDDDDNGSDSEEGEEGSETRSRNSKSKRNDPNAFATSLSKILSTKLSTNKRQDPVLARSAAAHEASKAAMDSALEAKARKQLRDQKRKALEKGRVKDVLVATTSVTTGEAEVSTTEIMETERRLRKVAQRGVVKLFNAVRAAQVAAVDAEKGTRKAGVIGMGQRAEKVNQMTKKGFLDLIASGGGGLSKNALEEA